MLYPPVPPVPTYQQRKILNGLSKPETIKQWSNHAEQWRAFNSEEYDATSDQLKKEAAESFLLLASEERKEMAELAEKIAREQAEAMLLEGMVDATGLGLGVEGGGDVGGGGVGGGGSVDDGSITSGISGGPLFPSSAIAAPATNDVDHHLDPNQVKRKKSRKGVAASDKMNIDEAANKAALMFETDALAQVRIDDD